MPARCTEEAKMATGNVDQLSGQVLQHASGKEIGEAIKILARTERLGGEFITDVNESRDIHARLVTVRDFDRLLKEVQGMRADIQELITAIAKEVTKK
jgi:hypothetical protein